MTGPTASVAAIFDPIRLRQAREYHGITKHLLGERAGVSAAAVGQYEAGNSRPSPEVLARLALALGFPVEFFARGRSDLVEEEPHFRSLRSTTRQQRRQAYTPAVFAAEIARVLDETVRMPRPDLPHYEIAADPKPSEIDKFAQQARSDLGVPDAPVPHMVRLLESKGAIVTRLRAETERVSAFSCPFRPRPVVVLSSNRGDKARSRMDAAHELGHLLLHHDADPGSQMIERQADTFAAAFLMPASLIRPHLPARLNWARLSDLKRTWGVSISALLYRSRTLGVISESAFRRAMVGMGTKTWPDGKTWRTREPVDLGDPERPALLGQAFDLAVTKGLTLESLANRLSLSADLVAEILGIYDDSRPLLNLETE